MFPKFLDPKNDIAFKKIFGTEKNKDILIRFVNDVIRFEGNRPISSVTFLPTVQDPDTVSHKTSIVDILCKDDEGCSYIVEMQVAKTKGFEKRAQFYAARAYCRQAGKGDLYQDLKEVIFLAIADYVMFPDKEDYKSDHVILDKKTYEHDLKDFSFTFIELPKFRKTLEELSSLEEKWCYFFKYAEEASGQDFEKLTEKDPILQRACHELDAAYWSEAEIGGYEQAEKRRKDYIAGMDQKFDEGVEKGRAEERGKAEAEKAELQAKAEAEKMELQAKAEAEKMELRAKAEAEKAELRAKAEAEKAELRAKAEKAEADKAELQAKMQATVQDRALAMKNIVRDLRNRGVSMSVIRQATGLSDKEIEG